MPILCRFDLTDPEEISKFVIRNLFPFKIIPRKSSENKDVNWKKKNFIFPNYLKFLKGYKNFKARKFLRARKIVFCNFL